MKHSVFRVLLDAVHTRMVELTESKGEEYKGADDNQFGNFERTAQDTGLSREQVWLVFFNKHFDALRTYVRDKATGTKRQRSESIVGRIDDAILYLILLRGMVGQNDGVGAGIDWPKAIAYKCPNCRSGKVVFDPATVGKVGCCDTCVGRFTLTDIQVDSEGGFTVVAENAHGR